MGGSHDHLHMAKDSEGIQSSTPITRFFGVEANPFIINCTMGLENPIDVDSIKSAFSNSILVEHPRFSSLLLTNCRGRYYWKKVPVNIDDHVILHHHHPKPTDATEVEQAINAYLADIAVSTPLRKDKPLWDLHLLLGLNCLVLRVHHTLGDGVSLMSMLSACFGNQSGNVGRKGNQWKGRGIWAMIKAIWFTILSVMKIAGWTVLIGDNKTVMTGGDGVELWPRKMVTVNFKIDDINKIKRANPPSTFNDVILGVISCGISKYLNAKSPEAPKSKPEITCLLSVNMRETNKLQESDLQKNDFPYWGNRSSFLFVPMHYTSGEYHSPLEHLASMKAIMDQKKQSFETQYVYWANYILVCLIGPKFARWLYGRYERHTTFLFSNMFGPEEKLVIAENSVTSMKVNLSSSCQSLSMHLISYEGMARLTVLVAKDLIHDPEYLALCYEQSYREMLRLASKG